jgi:hypothetical protein
VLEEPVHTRNYKQGEKEMGLKIKPSDIDTSRHFWDAFGKSEIEDEANVVIRFCQHRNSFRPFDDAEWNSFSNSLNCRLSFEQLVNRKLIVKEDEKWRITDVFILKCLATSPAEPVIID